MKACSRVVEDAAEWLERDEGVEREGGVVGYTLASGFNILHLASQVEFQQAIWLSI